MIRMTPDEIAELMRIYPDINHPLMIAWSAHNSARCSLILAADSTRQGLTDLAAQYHADAIESEDQANAVLTTYRSGVIA